MTQEQVADVATFSKRSLQDYEAGVTIPYKHLREIGKILNREVPWFLHGEPEEEAASVASLAARLEALEVLTSTGFLALEAAIVQLAEQLRPPGQAGDGGQ
jgi:transcriptional regulator with XRE-family HTH domain